MFRVHDRIRGFLFFFKNVWTFRKTLVNYRPWDHDCCLFAYRDGLVCLRDGLKKDNIFKRSEHKVKQINIALALIKRIEDNNYHKWYYDFSGMKTKNLDNGMVEVVDTGVTKKPNIPISDKSIIKRGLASENRDYDYLYRHLSKYSQGWWN